MPSNNPAVLGSLMPGANMGGSSVAVPPSPMSLGSQSIGGNTNPFLPVPSTGQTVPTITNSASMPANGTPMGTTAPGTLGGTPLVGQGGLLSPGTGTPNSSLMQGFKNAGVPAAIAAELAKFIQGGAGFNPQVAQALIAAMQPQVERGTENIMEQFSAMGNRFGSPAAVGLGDFESQVNLNMGQIFSQLYEQSVTNYLEVLMGAGKKAPTFGSTFQQSLAGSLGSGIGSFVTGG